MNKDIKSIQKKGVISITVFSLLTALLFSFNQLTQTPILIFAICMTIVASLVGKASYQNPEDSFNFWVITFIPFVIISLLGFVMFSLYDFGSSVFIGAGAPISIPFLGACVGCFCGYNVGKKRFHKVVSFVLWILEIILIISWIYSNFQLNTLIIIAAVVVSTIIGVIVGINCYKRQNLFRFWLLVSVLGVAIDVLAFWVGLLCFSGLDPIMFLVAAIPIALPFLGACLGRVIGY